MLGCKLCWKVLGNYINIFISHKDPNCFLGRINRGPLGARAPGPPTLSPPPKKKEQRKLSCFASESNCFFMRLLCRNRSAIYAGHGGVMRHQSLCPAANIMTTYLTLSFRRLCQRWEIVDNILQPNYSILL